MKRLLVMGVICAAFVSGMLGVCAADPIVNVGKVGYTDPATGKVTVRESEPAVINGPYLTITKTANKKEIKPGEEVEYTITVKNVGTKEATDVLISDRFPDELTCTGFVVIVENGQGVVVDKYNISKDQISEALKEGEASFRSKTFSVNIKKGSTLIEILTQRFGADYVAKLIAAGKL